MKMLKSILWLTLFLVALISCQKVETDDSNKQVVFTKSQLTLLSSSNQFGFNLFNELVAKEPEKNIFISPLSVSVALAMTYNGAEGRTASDMQNVLGYANMSRQSINEAYKEMLQIILNMEPKVTMQIANSIWYRNTFPVKEDFLNLNKTYFNAEVKPSDFNNPQTVDSINNWVKDKTNGKIDKIIDELDPLEVMDLLNAIYFKGSWKFKFDSQNTKAGNFYLSDGTTCNVDFMAMKETFRYMKNDKLSALELPYGGGGYSMLILLPNETKSVSDILASLTPQNWENWNSKLDSTSVFLQIPKFKFKYDISLKETLKKMGMEVAFSDTQANFSGISNEQLYISDVVHKTFVDVNEEGTEAAAVTIVHIVTLSADGPAYTMFDVNKPFIFAIKENTTNSAIFMGLVNKPVIE